MLVTQPRLWVLKFINFLPLYYGFWAFPQWSLEKVQIYYILTCLIDATAEEVLLRLRHDCVLLSHEAILRKSAKRGMGIQNSPSQAPL
jgi:hypothetical protein